MNFRWGSMQLCTTCPGNFFFFFFSREVGWDFLWTRTMDYELLTTLPFPTTHEFPVGTAVCLLAYVFIRDNDSDRLKWFPASFNYSINSSGYSLSFRECEKSDKQSFGCEVTHIQFNLSLSHTLTAMSWYHRNLGNILLTLLVIWHTFSVPSTCCD